MERTSKAKKITIIGKYDELSTKDDMTSLNSFESTEVIDFDFVDDSNEVPNVEVLLESNNCQLNENSFLELAKVKLY